MHVVLKIIDGQVTLFINSKKIDAAKDLKLAYGGDCKNCSIPAGLTFNAISWKNTASDADNVKVYISNIKITSE